MPRRSPRTASVAGAGLLTLVLLLVGAAPAAAHAALISTSPAAGTRLTDAPHQATITFNEVVTAQAGAVRVYDSRGHRLETGRLSRANGGRSLQVSLPSLDDGGYVVAWRVVSADGHPVGGAVTWRVGTGGNDVSAGVLQDLLSSAGGQDSVAAAAAVGRVVLFAGFVLLFGGWLFLLGLWPAGIGERRVGRLLWGAWVAMAVATVAGLGLEAADVAGLGLADAVRPSVVADVLATDYGRFGLARLVVLVAIAALLWRGRWGRLARSAAWGSVAASGVATALTITLSGHARTGRWVALAIPFDLVHLGAGAVWLGGLVMLLVGVLAGGADGSHALAVARRFSTVAFTAVAVIAVTGAVQGLRQLDGLSGLRDTNYGRLLVIKVVLVAVLLAVAGMSRSLVRGDGGDVGQVRQTVGAETLLAACVLSVTALLVAADPARSVGTHAFEATRLVGNTAVSVVVAPARTGPVDVHLYLSNPAAGLTAVKDAAATFSLPSKGITGLKVPFVFAGPDHYSANDLEIPIRGRWTLVITVRIGELDERTTTFTVPIS